MKRIAVISILGIGFGWWYPWLAVAVGVGVLVGWNVLEQPVVMANFVKTLKEMDFR